MIVGVSTPGRGEAPGSRAFDQDRSASTQGLQVLFYRAALPLSHQTLTFVSGLVRVHRREIGSVWRALNPGQQALLVLAYLRKGEPFAEVGFGVSTTTCWRYVNEPSNCSRRGRRSYGPRCARRSVRVWPT